MKTPLLVVLAPIKKAGNLHAVFVSLEYLEIGQSVYLVVLRPWPSYVPKVPTIPFRDQVVNLQALPSGGRPNPVIVVFSVCCAFTHRTLEFPTSSFVCY